MVDIEVKRGYEVLPDNNVRFGVRVINNSNAAISDVEILLDYSESLFELEGNKVQKLGNIPPTVPRTAKFILKPLGCIHKEEIGATVLYKDYQWKKHTLEMRPKEVHCVCPFLKEKSVARADFLMLSNSGYLEERGVNFDGVSVAKLVDFLGHTCKNRLYKVDEFPIENGKILYLAGDALGEKAYYLLTAVVKEYEGLTQVLLRASSDKSHGLNGFLNEILDNLRHLVVSASAREIGIIKKEQVINIIDSVVQRSTISMEEGEPSVKIKDSMVQRTEIKGDEERKRREQERPREEREEQERLHRQREEEEAKEEYECPTCGAAVSADATTCPECGEVFEENEGEEKEEQEKLRGEKEKEEEEEYHHHAVEEKEQQEEEERIAREKEEPVEETEYEAQEEEKGTSYKKFLAVAVVLGVLLLGYWVLAPEPNPSLTPEQQAQQDRYNPEFWVVNQPFYSISDALNITPVGAVSASYADIESMTPQMVQWVRAQLPVNDVDSLYKSNTTKMYLANLREGNNASLLLLSTMFPEKNDFEYIVIPDIYPPILKRRDTGAINILGNPVIYTFPNTAVEVLEIIASQNKTATAYDQYEGLLNKVEPAPYQTINSTVSFADQLYMGVREVNGNYERTTVYLNLNSNTLKKLNQLKANSIQRGFGQYNITKSGNYIIVKIVSPDLSRVLNEEIS